MRSDFEDDRSAQDRSGHGTFVCAVIAAQYARVEQSKLNPREIYDVPSGVLPASRIWVASGMSARPVVISGVAEYPLDFGRY